MSDLIKSLPIAEFAFPGRLRDKLVAAILDGSKTSTTSLLVEYGDEELPQPGARQVVVDSDSKPVCVIETTGVRVARLADVDDQFARDEGEGFAGYSDWRVGHERFWHSTAMREELGDPEFTVTDDTLVVLERFTLVRTF